MSVEKKRFFVSSSDDPKPSEKVDISENSLFVGNSDDDEIEVLSGDEQSPQKPFISQTAPEPPKIASEPPPTTSARPRVSSEQTSAPDPIKLELFSSQLTNAIGEISPRFHRYLFKKYFGKPDYIQLAINEYLDGIDPEEMSQVLHDNLIPDADNKRPLDEDLTTQVDNLYHRMLLESSKNRKEIEKKSWRRYIGSLPVQAWATRPTMKPLQYLEKLFLKRLIPKNSNMSNSSIIRLCTVPQNNEKFGREMARIPEDLTRTLSPLFDLDIASFETTVLETTKKRLSTGDSFLIQIDIFFKNSAFENKGQETTTQDLRAVKKQKLNTTKTGFNFSSESENEAQLRLRQFALSKLFETLSIKPTKSMVDTHLSQAAPVLPSISPDDCPTLTQTQAEPINLDSDSELDEDAPEIKPVDHVNLDQLKEFYQANNQSSLLNSLPETTKPPSSNFGLELRPYQMHGLSWMLTREKEISTLEILASNDDDHGALSTQSKKEIREKEDGVMNPLWRRYKWPKDSSVGGSENPETPSQEGKYFYANMYNGEMSLEKPLIRNMLKGGILADEMGLGKTISALALVNSVPYDPTPASTVFKRPYASKTTLIVVPMSLLSQWKSEFDKANNNKNHFCYIYYGDSTESNLTQLLCNNNSTNVPVVVLTTYGTIVNEYNRINKFRGVNGELPETGLYSVSYFRIILDEAHNIRNRNTKSAKSIYELSSDRKWALTGTPIINRLDDLYSLVKFLDLDPWCNFSYWKTFVTLPFEEKRISQTLDVIKSILEPIFLRRTKNMKQKNGKPMVELPEKEVVIEQIKFNQREAQIYNWFKAKANRSFKEGINSGQLLRQYTQILTHILRLRQVCCHTDLVGTSHEMEEVDDNSDDRESLKDELRELTDQKGNSGYKNETEINQAMYPLYLKINIEDSECSICTQAPIALGEMVVTPCGHQFCLNCLLEHIEFQANRGQDCFCPNCREEISKYKLFKLRMKETSKKEIRFHTRADIDDPSEKYKFQLHLYDPDKTSSKIQALIGHLRTLKAQNPGEKVIVFSQFSSYLDIIENEIKIQGGKDFVVYKFDGRLQLAERKKVLDKFNDNHVINKVTVLLLSLKAGGVGLNLTTASKAFMMDPWWSPSVEDQAIDRIHRIGQNETVKVVRFIMENSIEIKMLKIQERKKQIGEAVGAEEEERRKRRIEEIQILFEE